VSAIIAVVGLVASLFVPFAYCRYGCPTGELLRLVKSGGGHDKVQQRDLVAVGLVACVAVGLFGPKLWETCQRSAATASRSNHARTVEISGKAFGTTWSVKLRGDHSAAPLQTAVAAELERIENSFSHWRPDSFTAQFNGSETTLATEQPAELLQLIARAQALSQRTQGRYDITVAPLVNAWCYGPSGEKKAPTDEELARLRERVGWEKVTVDLEAKTLRKKHPELQIDLGSMLQGYAADRAKIILDEAGVTEYLINVGGELLARGSWQVGIEDPRNPQQMLRTFQLQDAALATSGLYRAEKHIIAPQTGKPVATTTTLCAVSAPTAIEADALATAMLTVGLPAAIQLADQQKVAVFLFDQSQGERANIAGEKLLGAR
jgi:thiamine biosynthesis lipoprotein